MDQAAQTAASAYRFEDFLLDPARRSLTRGAQRVELRPKSFDVLVVLVRSAGRALAKDDIVKTVWPGLIVTDESLTRCVSDVRHALGDDAQRLVKTLPRFGYQFAVPVAQSFVGAPVAPASGVERTALSADTGPAPAWTWLAAGLLIIGALAAAAWWHGSRQPAAAAVDLSLVVMPLQVRDGNPQLDYLAEAMAEEISVDLSRIPDSVVIARSSANSYRGRQVDARQVGRELGVRYVLEGSLDRIDTEIRLSLQLVDATSGHTLWAERFDGGIGDMAALHRRITGTVAQSLRLRLIEAESARASRRPVADATAHDLTLRAWSKLGQRSPDAVAEARDILQRALSRDPQSALAWGLLADTYTADVGGRLLRLRGASREEWLELAAKASERAYEIDPDHPNAVGARATVLSLQGRSEQALTMIERKLALNRNDASAWYRLSYTYATLGRAEDAIRAGHEAVRLSPRDSELCGFYVVIAAAHLHLNQDRAALEWARKSALERPDFSVARAWIASAAAHAGEMDAARMAVAEFRRMQPDYTVGSFRAERLCANAVCDAQRERFFAGLHKAGLPD
jgi:TolB-like protein/DNA-binding winged helix-turn-helix (wHTH) protein/cytochrome c-type biogenesis protein CcmH/NrfG